MSDTDSNEAGSGPSVPTIGLDKALDAIRSAGPYGVKHPRSAFAQHLGHKSDSGPFRQKLAALREYGLVKRSRGSADVELTDLGMRLAVPLSDAAEAMDKQEAFFECGLFYGMYEAMAKGVNLDTSAIAATAFHRYRVVGPQRDALAQVFVVSARTANLAEELGDGRVRLLPRSADGRIPTGQPVTNPAGIPTESNTQSSPEASARPSATPVPAGLATDLTVRRPLPEGEVAFIVRSTRPMPAKAFGLLQTLTETVDQLAAEFLAVAPPEEGE